jgi:hypothetical protein
MNDNDSMADKVEDVKDAAADKAADAKEATAETADKVEDKAKDVMEQVKSEALDAMATLGGLLHKAGDAMVNKAEELTHKDLDKDGKVGNEEA